MWGEKAEQEKGYVLKRSRPAHRCAASGRHRRRVPRRSRRMRKATSRGSTVSLHLQQFLFLPTLLDADAARRALPLPTPTYKPASHLTSPPPSRFALPHPTRSSKRGFAILRRRRPVALPPCFSCLRSPERGFVRRSLLDFRSPTRGVGYRGQRVVDATRSPSPSRV